MYEIVASMIAGLLSGGIVGAMTLRFHYKNLYADTVSKNRMDWINNFREEMSTIIATVQSVRGKCQNKDELIYDAEKARAKLLTRLNQDTSKKGNEYNKTLTQILEKLDFNQAANSSNDVIPTLIELTRKILEPEWQRVKREAKGKE